MPMKPSDKIAFCGVAAAMSVVLMFFTGLIPVATIAIPAIAGCVLIAVVAEMGISWGFGVFAVCAVLSFLLAPDREAALVYLLFFGYYPVLYAILGKIRGRALRYGVKLLVFNAAVAAEGLLSVYVLGIPMETIGPLGKFTIPVLWILANVVFVLYDYALGGLIQTYFQRLHPKLRKLLHKGG